jgi:hypothetical protein
LGIILPISLGMSFGFKPALCFDFLTRAWKKQNYGTCLQVFPAACRIGAIYGRETFF